MQMFLVWRFFIAIITVLVVSVIIFIMSRAAGDPRALLLDDYSTMEDWDRMGAALGLDKPYYQQYGIFIKDALKGEFGQSIKQGRPAMHIVIERLPATLQLGRGLFSPISPHRRSLGRIGGSQAGQRYRPVWQGCGPRWTVSSIFWLGIMLMFFFSVNLGWLPPFGREDPRGIILPAVTLGWFYAAANLRLIRSAMLDVLDSEYIKLARAKGVSSQNVIVKHALRNAIIPALTFAGVTLGALVTGSLVVETVFAWPGLGKLAVDALFALDYAVLQAVVIVFTLLYVAASFTVDVLYAFVDPRIRFT